MWKTHHKIGVRNIPNITNGGGEYLAATPKNCTSPEYEDIKYENETHVPNTIEKYNFFKLFLMSNTANHMNAKMKALINFKE